MTERNGASDPDMPGVSVGKNDSGPAGPKEN